MYQDHFGLQRHLFEEGIAQGGDVFLGAPQKLAVTNLGVALTLRDSVALLTGPSGVGKTTLAAHTLRALTTRLALGWVGTAPATGHELLEMLLTEFGFSPYKNSRVERLQLWRQYLNEMRATDTRVCVLVESAENLQLEVLAALESLTAADPNGCPGANVVLTARTGLDLLSEPALAAFKQRTRLRWNLEPLTRVELCDYLTHCITSAGGKTLKLFTDEALDALHQYSGGIIRTTNNLCATALTLAASAREPQVSAPLITQVAVDVFGLAPAPGVVATPWPTVAQAEPKANQAPPTPPPTSPPPAIAPRAAAPPLTAAPTPATPPPAAPMPTMPPLSALKPVTLSPAPSSVVAKPQAVAPATVEPPAAVPPPPPPVAKAAVPPPIASPAPTPIPAKAPSMPPSHALAARVAATRAAQAAATPASRPLPDRPAAAAPAANAKSTTLNAQPPAAPAPAATSPTTPHVPSTPKSMPQTPTPTGAGGRAAAPTRAPLAPMAERQPPAAAPKAPSPPATPAPAARSSAPPPTAGTKPAAEVPVLTVEFESSPELASDDEEDFSFDLALSGGQIDAVLAEDLSDLPVLNDTVDGSSSDDSMVIQFDEETQHKLANLEALANAKALEDISNSMAETLFGDAELDKLAATLALATGKRDDASNDDEPQHPAKARTAP
jgi:type II secretory pathway predicted ATPase ExeA